MISLGDFEMIGFLVALIKSDNVFGLQISLIGLFWSWSYIIDLTETARRFMLPILVVSILVAVVMFTCKRLCHNL